MLESNRALVLLSGGQDSTTCLAWALDRYELVETIAFDYGQRHAIELECRHVVRAKISECNAKWKVRLGEDHLVDLGGLGKISQTALTQDVAIRMEQTGLPNTFVPGRNLLFLTMAAAVAYRRGIKNLVTGVCETDYSGYPDCRDDTIKSLQVTLNLGMESGFTIHTPLMWIDKAGTWALAESLGGMRLVELIVEHTHTCYFGIRSQRKAWGYGCGTCPACDLRSQGHAKYAT